MNRLNSAFQHKILTLDIANISPSKELGRQILGSGKYREILASVRAIGLVEPPVVTFRDGRAVLLDGHLRLKALEELGTLKVDCLVATDDESYTYNRHVSHLSNVQERNMIVKAIERGVPPIRIAEALGIDIRTLESKRDRLEGINPDVVEMLSTKCIPNKTFECLKRMKDMRQLEVVNCMISANNFSAQLAHHFWADTKPEMLRVSPRKKQNEEDIEKLATLEGAVSRVHREYGMIYDDYGRHVSRLQIAQAYVRQLFKNARARRYLSKNYPDIFRRFGELVELESVEDIKSKAED